MSHTHEAPERTQSVSSADSLPFQTPAESPVRDIAYPYHVPTTDDLRRNRPELLSSWQAENPSIPELQLNGYAAEDAQHGHQAGANSTGQASVSTTNNDHGLNRQFALQQEPASDQSSLTEVDIVTGVGTGLPPDQDSRPQEVELSASQTLLPEEGDGPGSRSPDYDKPPGLQQQIDRALVKSSHEFGGEFLPADAEREILTKSAVSVELRREGFTKPETKSLASKIWDASTYKEGDHEKFRSRRKIFMILVLMGQVKKIEYFVEHDIWDPELPFTRGTSDNMVLLPSGDNPSPMRCFESDGQGTLNHVRAFSDYQWYFLAPIFQLSDGIESPKKVIHYNIKSNTVLPFIEQRKKQEPHQQGAFGQVWAVKIHPAHHNDGDRTQNPWFAIKQLNTSKEDDFNEEVKALKRMIHTENDHLIRLLLTYHYRNTWYLLFPLADDNLRDFWRSCLPIVPRSFSRALWVAQQCAGLVQGVSDVHYHKPSRELEQQLSVSQQDKNFGRHGDLKPENILWFRKSSERLDDEIDMGILKITDFGLSRFHGSQTVVENHHPVGFPISPTYQAPEYEMKKTLSPEYDIWSLGCVLLEFIIWYYRGWEGVDKFSRDRADDDDNDIKGDTYFQIVTIDKPKPNDIGARLKVSVQKWIMELRGDLECSQFFQELLDYVHRYMLRIRTDKRKKSSILATEIKEMVSRCETDPKYCAAPQPEPLPVERANSSSLVPVAAPVELSPQTKEEIRERGCAPQHTGQLEGVGDGAPDSPWRSPTQFNQLGVSSSETETDRNNLHLTTEARPPRTAPDERPLSILSETSSQGLAHAQPFVNARYYVPDSATQSSPTSSTRTNSIPSPHLPPMPLAMSTVEENARAEHEESTPLADNELVRWGSGPPVAHMSSRRSSSLPGLAKFREPLGTHGTSRESTNITQSPGLFWEASNGVMEESLDTPNTTQRSLADSVVATSDATKRRDEQAPNFDQELRTSEEPKSDEPQDTVTVEATGETLETGTSVETEAEREIAPPPDAAKEDEGGPTEGHSEQREEDHSAEPVDPKWWKLWTQKLNSIAKALCCRRTRTNRG